MHIHISFASLFGTSIRSWQTYILCICRSLLCIYRSHLHIFCVCIFISLSKVFWHGYLVMRDIHMSVLVDRGWWGMGGGGFHAALTTEKMLWSSLSLSCLHSLSLSLSLSDFFYSFCDSLFLYHSVSPSSCLSLSPSASLSVSLSLSLSALTGQSSWSNTVGLICVYAGLFYRSHLCTRRSLLQVSLVSIQASFAGLFYVYTGLFYRSHLCIRRSLVQVIPVNIQVSFTGLFCVYTDLFCNFHTSIRRSLLQVTFVCIQVSFTGLSCVYHRRRRSDLNNYDCQNFQQVFTRESQNFHTSFLVCKRTPRHSKDLTSNRLISNSKKIQSDLLRE